MGSDEEFANQHPLLNSRPPFLPPATPAQARDALEQKRGLAAMLSPDAPISTLFQPIHAQPGLASMLGYDGPKPPPSKGLADMLLQNGITELPGSDARLVNISTDPEHPAYMTAKGTVIRVNKPGPATTLPAGDNLGRSIKFADAMGTGSILLTGGSEAQDHGKNTLLDAHSNNEAMDVHPNPSWDPEKVRQAAIAAGYTHGIYEIKKEGPHWHFQAGPENIKGDPSLYELTRGPIRTKDYTKVPEES